MNTQTSRSFLHSCVKVPIDPCNNCPAPIYNRPKIYLGRLTKTPLSDTNKTTLKLTVDEEVDSLFINSDIRSLAKFYDSIPEYCDINHLPNEEFYSTLNTLRSTCCELRAKSARPHLIEEGCSSNTSSSTTTHCVKRKSNKQTTGSKTKGKSRTATGESSSKKHSGKNNSKRHVVCAKSYCEKANFFDNSHKKDDSNKSRIKKSYKEEFDSEINAIQKSFKDFEDELQQRHAVTPTTASRELAKKTVEEKNKNGAMKKNRNKSMQKKFASNLLETFKISNSDSHGGVDGNIRALSQTSNKSLQKVLKKSYSFDDINSITDCKHKDIDDEKNKNRPETEITIKRVPLKYSTYFPHTSVALTKSSGTPKIVIESPSSETISTRSSSHSSGKRKKKAKHKKQNDDFTVPFTIFDLDVKAKVEKNTPSPVHPVARPNLAATLRAEVSKRKLKELKNNCTYHDTTPQFDWEVRKTPAWKSLSLNETHKEILSMRLATRKAEQAQQQRDYELNMALMRQRVKSAPLLLEGATFWGPNIGKLTHTCQREGATHCCATVSNKQQRKARSKSAADGRRLFCTHVDTISECSSQKQGGRSSKRRMLRKIYGGAVGGGGSGKVHASNNSLQLPTARKRASKSVEKKQESVAGSLETASPVALNDSADELSSLDRAFL